MSVGWSDKTLAFKVNTDTASGKMENSRLMRELLEAVPGVEVEHVSSDEDDDGLMHGRVGFKTLPSAQEKEVLEGVVKAHNSQPPKMVRRGKEFIELTVGTTKWTRHRCRIQFQKGFREVPTVEIRDPEFDGAIGLNVLRVTEDYFDIAVEARGRRKKSLRGLTTVAFNWEARV